MLLFDTVENASDSDSDSDSDIDSGKPQMSPVTNVFVWFRLGNVKIFYEQSFLRRLLALSTLAQGGLASGSPLSPQGGTVSASHFMGTDSDTLKTLCAAVAADKSPSGRITTIGQLSFDFESACIELCFPDINILELDTVVASKKVHEVYILKLVLGSITMKREPLYKLNAGEVMSGVAYDINELMKTPTKQLWKVVDAVVSTVTESWIASKKPPAVIEILDLEVILINAGMAKSEHTEFSTLKSTENMQRQRQTGLKNRIELTNETNGGFASYGHRSLFAQPWSSKLIIANSASGVSSGSSQYTIDSFSSSLHLKLSIKVFQ